MNGGGKYIIILLLIIPAIFAGKKIIDYGIDKLFVFVGTNPAAREIVRTGAQIIGTKSEKDLKIEYENYLTAHGSFSALAGSKSRPMSYEEFKRDYEKRGDYFLKEIEESSIRIQWKNIKDKRHFYDWCRQSGYISEEEYKEYTRQQFSRSSSFDEAPPEKLMQYVGQFVKK